MANDLNPYEPPKIPSSGTPFAERSADIVELEQRIAELECKVARSWFLRANPLHRVVAVWGYFLLGYAMIAMVAIPIIWLLDWLTGHL
jgi:hypothetical protein